MKKKYTIPKTKYMPIFPGDLMIPGSIVVDPDTEGHQDEAESPSGFWDSESTLPHSKSVWD